MTQDQVYSIVSNLQKIEQTLREVLRTRVTIDNSQPLEVSIPGTITAEISNQLDISTLATEDTLAKVWADTTSLDGKDFATETTLADVKTAVESLSLDSGGAISTDNTSTTPLLAGATFTGVAEQNNYVDVMVSCKTDQAGVLYFDFSNDGVNWDTFPSSGFTVSAGIHEYHNAVKGQRYFRVRMYNSSASPQTYLRLYTYFGRYRQGNLPLNQSISSDADAIITRGVLVGSTDGGQFINVPVTQEGHLEVALHAPRLPFGSIHVENLIPVFQSDAVYGINDGQETATTSLGGTATASDSNFVVSTGVTMYAQGVIQSRKRLRYRAGQGVVGRFTAIYSTPASYAYTLAGFGHAEDGVYFGYKEILGATPAFGILYVNRGKREVRTLTVSVASSHTENVTVTLNGTAYTVAVTNSGNIQRTVYEISRGTYAGWKAYPSGATVVFVADSAGSKAGAYTLAGTSATGAFAATRPGATSTETFIPQSSWNGDKLDGTGASGVTANWQLGNVFQIGIQYLGFGAITFQVEVTPTDANNADFVTVHTIKLPNTLSTTSFRNPSFPFTMAAYSAGSTTDVSVKVGSFAGFIEGDIRLHGNRFSYFNTSAAVTAGAYLPLFTIQNSYYYGGIPNQVVVNILSLTAAIKHNFPGSIFVIKNATLTGNPNFSSYSTNSATLWDTSATGATWSTNDQLIWTGQLGDTGELSHVFSDSVTLQPGESLTVAGRTFSGTATAVLAAINTREDQ